MFAAAPEGSIIYLESVTVEFDGFKALHDLNFFMDYRELRVVIGPNGAGKTTLLDVISGKVQPVAGRVIFGKSTDLVGRRENEIASLGIGRKFQTPSIFANLSVRENLELSLARPSKGVVATLRARLDGDQRRRIEETMGKVPSVVLFNKCDLTAEGSEAELAVPEGLASFRTSAKTGRMSAMRRPDRRRLRRGLSLLRCNVLDRSTGPA